MKCCAIIPARGKSKGVPGKNSRPFAGGKSLLERAIDACFEAVHIEAVFVSTDSGQVKMLASATGAVVIDRPHELSTDESTTASALLHADAYVPVEYDTVCLVQCNAPLLSPRTIDRACDVLEKSESRPAMVVSALPFDGLVVQPTIDGRVRGVGWSPLMGVPRRQERIDQEVITGEVWAIDRQRFIERGTIYGCDFETSLSAAPIRLEIDSQSDWDFAEQVMRDIECVQRAS